MFYGLSAFPLTPIKNRQIDHDALSLLVVSATEGGANSIGALGSTGSYAYLERDDRYAVARTAVNAAGPIPVIVGVGSVSTTAVLRNVDDAMSVGAAGILLAPLSYHPLTNSEVFGLFDDVTKRFDIPVVIYDNVATTGFIFTAELLGHIAHLPNIASIKLDTLAVDPVAARAQVEKLRALAPKGVSVGISGDAASPRGLLAGCDVWYSSIGGLFPRTCAEITNAALAGDSDRALALTAELSPIWDLFARYGSFRTSAAIATMVGLLAEDAVYAPVRPLAGEARESVSVALERIGSRF